MLRSEAPPFVDVKELSSSQLVWRRVAAPPASPFCLSALKIWGASKGPARIQNAASDATERASSRETSGCPRREERLVRSLITAAAR